MPVLPEKLQTPADEPNALLRALNNAYVQIAEWSSPIDAVANCVLHEIFDARAALTHQASEREKKSGIPASEADSRASPGVSVASDHLALFDEAKLRQEIVSVWGAYGAHAEVFDAMRAALAERQAVPETRREAIDAVERVACLVAETQPVWAGHLRTLLASLPAAPTEDAKDAARDVLAERERQKTVEGWTPEHDDEHNAGELAAAGAAYAIAAADTIHPFSQGDGDFGASPPSCWVWSKDWWKPTTPRRNLVKAGALILAEIERLDRLSASAEGEK